MLGPARFTAPWYEGESAVFETLGVLGVVGVGNRDSRDFCNHSVEAKNCLVEVDMATASKKVTIEDIDVVLRDAQVCNVQLNFLHRLLNQPNVDEKRIAEIESKCATIFRDMMSNLYSVLDQIYYYLYCHFQNNGNVSFSSVANQIKQPVAQNLKWSEDSKQNRYD